MDVYFKVSDRGRQQRLGVCCVEGCPFYVYASWDSRRACIVVKTVKSEHWRQRNMKRNRQLKSNLVAGQFLEVFKTRPHWPTKEIQECVRKAFKMLVSRDFAYKIKYQAHRMLHGSMHDHYSKLGGYMVALERSSPGTRLELVTDCEKEPPTFKRLFICFEGLKVGWHTTTKKEACRKVLVVDACFLKTFLGGQLMSAVGRDSNDQMFLVCWAIVEGENNDSWEWFFKQMQSTLDLKEGEGMTIISDEHQRILVKKQTMMKATTMLCPRIQAKLEIEKQKTAECEVMPSSETLFNVT
ncbi:uncharacterized protein LOC110734080 [Chenopodium quinoa]|uniref:uncharacterized protein LOC110734080 n=1 Tax=Chenopodium quinoa TaxID=63459 RepID=UPI000B7773CA|nr:uncharacterized protein LOC110734080 [Chenopodium quinoa]